MYNSITYFFEVALALRNECEESYDSLKSAKIDALAKVCAEVIKHGDIPSQFYIEGYYPIHTELVLDLFYLLSIGIRNTYSGERYTANGKVYWVNFCTF